MGKDLLKQLGDIELNPSTKSQIESQQPSVPLNVAPKESAAETRGKGGEPTIPQLYQEEVPEVTLPDGTKVKMQGEQAFKEANRYRDPATQAMMLGAGLEGLSMIAPPAGAAGMATLLPRAAARMGRPLAWPGRLETGASMLRTGVSAGGGEKVSELGRGTPFEAQANIVGDLLSLLGPGGLKNFGRTIAPHVVPDTAAAAKAAERRGLSISPKQAASTTPRGFTAYSEPNNTEVTRLMTSAADPAAIGQRGHNGVARIDEGWFRGTNQRYDQAYEYIFSPQNIFQLSVGHQDAVVNAVSDAMKANVPGAEKFAEEASRRAPWLVQPSVFPMGGGGLRSNPNFLPFDGPQLRVARDLIRGLQKSTKPETRHLGNELWRLTMENVKAVDPHIHQQLQLTNNGYRHFRLLEEMDKAGKINQGHIDLQWLDDQLRSGFGSEAYRHGTDQSVAAELGRYGKKLRMGNQPVGQTTAERVAEALIGSSGSLAALLPFLAEGGDFNWPRMAAAGAAGLTASFPGRKAILSGAQKATSAAGRAIQRMPRPQEDDLATRARKVLATTSIPGVGAAKVPIPGPAHTYGKAREGLSALIANLLERPKEGE